MQRNRNVKVMGWWVLLAAIPFLWISSCGKEKVNRPDPKPTYNFSLTDVNPTSPTYGQAISPASYIGHPVVLFAGSAG